MASSSSLSAPHPHHHSNLHFHSQPPVNVDNLIDLTSYEEEYDYLVARRRAVSSIAGPTSPTTKEVDAVTRIRDETATFRGGLDQDKNGNRDDDEDDDLKKVAQMLGLDKNESTVTSQSTGIEVAALDSTVRFLSGALSGRTRKISSPTVTSPTNLFPSSLSLQIREELEELEKVTALLSEDDLEDKRSVIRLEDILRTKNRTTSSSKERAVHSPEPIPATPSLETEYFSTRGLKGVRNDPDVLRMLTPEPIPTTPSLETELKLSTDGKSRDKYTTGSLSHRERLRTPEPIPATPSLELEPYPSRRNSAISRKIDDEPSNRRQKSDIESIDVIDVRGGSNRSKSVTFLTEGGEGNNVIVEHRQLGSNSRDAYEEIDVLLPKEAGEALQSPSYESDPLLGSKSMYRRAIMARRRKSAARSGTSSFKPIQKDYEEPDFVEESPVHHSTREKYRSLVISPVRSSMDQDDIPGVFWGSPATKRSPTGTTVRDSFRVDKTDSGHDDDTREDEEERSSLDEDKRDKIESPRSTGSPRSHPLLTTSDCVSTTLHCKSMSPSGEKIYDFNQNDDATHLRRANSLSSRSKKSNPDLEMAEYAFQTLTGRSRRPVIIDVEAADALSEVRSGSGMQSSVDRMDSPRSIKTTSPRMDSLDRVDSIRSNKTSSPRSDSTPISTKSSRPNSPKAAMPGMEPVPVLSQMTGDKSPYTHGDKKLGGANPLSMLADSIEDFPGIPQVKSEPVVLGTGSRDDVIRVDDLEIPRVMSEPHSRAVRFLDDSLKNTVIEVPELRHSASEPKQDAAPMVASRSDENLGRRRETKIVKVTPESPRRPDENSRCLSPGRKSTLQDRLSAEMRKENDEAIRKSAMLQIDPEDFSNIVNRGSDLNLVDTTEKSLIQLVNSVDDGETTTAPVDEPIPKPYSHDLAISDSETSTSIVDSDVEELKGSSNGVVPEVKKKKSVEFAISVPEPGENKGSNRAGQESECENTSGEEYGKYSSDENGGQTSGNETDSKLSIINSESSESELGVDPELDPHVLYDSEAMRFVVQMLDRSCAWLEDDGCAACNYQGPNSSLSLLREIKKRSHDKTQGREDLSQAATPKASNSRHSRVTGKASTLVRNAAKQGAASSLVQNLQQVKERRSQRALRNSDTAESAKVPRQAVSVFARPRRRQASGSRQTSTPESESEEELGVRRSPPRRRRSQSPRKRSTVIQSDAPDGSPSPSAMVVMLQGEGESAQESENPVSPFQKKLQERLASVRGHGDSSTDQNASIIVCDNEHTLVQGSQSFATQPSPIPDIVLAESQRSEIRSMETQQSGSRCSSSMRSQPSQPVSPSQGSDSRSARSGIRSSSSMRSTTPLQMSMSQTSEARSTSSQRSSKRPSSPEVRQTVRIVAMETSESRRTNSFQAISPPSVASPGAVPYSVDQPRDSSRGRQDAPGSHGKIIEIDSRTSPISRSSSNTRAASSPSSARGHRDNPPQPNNGNASREKPEGDSSRRSSSSHASKPKSDVSRRASSSHSSKEPSVMSTNGSAINKSHSSDSSQRHLPALSRRGSSGGFGGSGGPEQPQRLRKTSSSGGRSVSSASTSGSAALSRSSYTSRMDYRLETIHEQGTPLSSTASSPLGSGRGGNPFHGLTEAERLAALELAEKLRRRAANLKRRRRAREKRMTDFLLNDEEDPANS